MFLRNVGIYLRVYTASQPRRTTLSSSPPWEPQISHSPTVSWNQFPCVRKLSFRYQLPTGAQFRRPVFIDPIMNVSDIFSTFHWNHPSFQQSSLTRHVTQQKLCTANIRSKPLCLNIWKHWFFILEDKHMACFSFHHHCLFDEGIMLSYISTEAISWNTKFSEDYIGMRHTFAVSFLVNYSLCLILSNAVVRVKIFNLFYKCIPWLKPSGFWKKSIVDVVLCCDVVWTCR
jgi:hypothetical protein